MSDRMAKWPDWMKQPYRPREQPGAGSTLWLWVLGLGATLAALAGVARRLWLAP